MNGTKRKTISVTVCGAKKLKRPTLVALAYALKAAYEQESRRCVSRATHMAYRKRR